MANAVQHVSLYRQKQGKLLAMLEQAGATGAGITYQPTAEGYEVAGEADGVRVAYTAGQSLTKFIGNSFELISRRTR